jgi:CDP-4-dehydro-6-deoxyglucose reductase
MAAVLHELPTHDGQIRSSRVQVVQGKIVKTKKLTYDTMELVVRCDHGSTPLNAVAGQYATLFTSAASEKARAYSFARAPENEADNEYTFFVRLVHGGEFSGWLFAKDRSGESIKLSGPLGRFILDLTKRPMLCVAGGSGMSAILALLQHASNLMVPRDCLFLYGARTQRDLYCLDEIELIKNDWNNKHKFEFVPVLSDEHGTNWQGATGFVTDFLKMGYLDKGYDVKSSKAYFCGPPPMINAGLSVLTAAGMSQRDISYDKFEDMASPAPVIDNSACVVCDECLLVKPVENCIVEVANLRTVNGGETFSSYDRIRPAQTAGLYYNTLYIDEKECIRCFACVESCPVGAISPQYKNEGRALRNVVIRS